MKAYKIIIVGCDDETKIEMDLNDNECELLKRVSALSEKTSTYGCMPILQIVTNECLKCKQYHKNGTFETCQGSTQVCDKFSEVAK
jgi:hypothetical protein